MKNLQKVIPILTVKDSPEVLTRFCMVNPLVKLSLEGKIDCPK
jgi:hypothetical protein